MKHKIEIFNLLGNYLTKLQIKIVSLIDKDSLWHDYLGFMDYVSYVWILYII